MREILFKAKNLKNEWVEGYVFRYSDGRTIITSDRPQMIPSIDHVIPETICEFTGLTDKNGNKIFEGDKVNILHQNEVLTGIIEYLDDRFIVAVGMWAGDLRTYAKTRNLFCEVIGNIHEGEEKC